jgi:L-rhamnose isomerase
MGEEGLFAMKSHVLHRRVRSRDLYDLKMFLERGKRLTDIFQAASAADPACSEEYAKAVLIGEVALDKEDEGFDSIGATESMQDIYAFFQGVVDAHEKPLPKKHG